MTPDEVIAVAMLLTGIWLVRWILYTEEEPVQPARYMARIEPHQGGGYSVFFQLAARPDVVMTRYGSWWDKADAALALQLLASEFMPVDELELDEVCDGR